MPKNKKNIETSLFFGSLNILNFYRHDLLFSYPHYNVHHFDVKQYYNLL